MTALRNRPSGASLAWAVLWVASCGEEGGDTGPKDMAPPHDEAAPPDVASEPTTCPFDDEPACGGLVLCPDGGFVCVTNDPPADGSTCRLACETRCPDPCDRVCVPLATGGAACVPGTGPGEPCSPEVCNPGLDCIDDGFGRSFCRHRCGPDQDPKYCAEKHFSCNLVPNSNRRVCVPGGGSLTEGLSCAEPTARCRTDVDPPLLCATHAGGTTCVRSCDPTATPDGCVGGETCRAVAEEEGHPIGYACL